LQPVATGCNPFEPLNIAAIDPNSSIQKSSVCQNLLAKMMLVVSYRAVACPRAGAPSPTELGGNDIGACLVQRPLVRAQGRQTRAYFDPHTTAVAMSPAGIYAARGRTVQPLSRPDFAPPLPANTDRLTKLQPVATGCNSFAPPNMTAIDTNASSKKFGPPKFLAKM